MRVPMGWLREFVEVDLAAGELAERLLASGLAVERVERVGQEFRELRVGRVVEVQPHPARPGLKVASVALGDGQRAQAVTGAPNTRPGLTVAVALPGTRPPGMGAAVQAVEVAGVRSEAVLLSLREAGLGEDHRGLWELPQEVVPGACLAEALGLEDDVLEVDVYPNRADCMSVLGLAREVAAALGRPWREPELDFEETPEPASRWAGVEVESWDDCPRYVARVMGNLPAGSSPWWLVRRLYQAGMRSVSPVVDVTNYVMLEVGQPLHAFDLDRLEGQRVVVRRARPGERLVTLDGRERAVDEQMLVIADARRPQGLAGIMGGAESEVTPQTRCILLEAACFRAALVRRTARRLGLRTEASARFERGLAPALAEWGSRRAAHLLWRMGAWVARGSVDRMSPGRDDRRTVELRPERVNRVLGTQLASEQMASYLRRLGIEVTPQPGGRLHCQLPPWRLDLQEEDDLAEEVARLHGYHRVPSRLPTATARGRWAPETALAFRVREILRSMGLFEVLTYTFMDQEELAQLGIPPDHPWRRAVAVANPLSEEQGWLRTTLRPGLVRVLRLNVTRSQGQVRVFEVGRVFRPSTQASDSSGSSGPGGAPGPSGEALPEERLAVGVALLDVPGAMEREWHTPARPADFYDLKGLLEALAGELGAELAFVPEEHPGLHPGRSASLWVNGPSGGSQPVGYAGELHPVVLQRLELPGRALVAELD
ncbi:MAG TPA: phenylalanine--tRNA ligase subunit beta, partial [Limnochordales bacterium]